MLKVASCKLCGLVYRTGQLRQLIEKALINPIDETGKQEKPRFYETRILICKKCYDRIIRKQGIPMRRVDDLFDMPYMDEGISGVKNIEPERLKGRKKRKAKETVAEEGGTVDSGLTPLERKDNAEYEAQIAKLKEPAPKVKRGRKKKEAFAGQPEGGQGFAGTPEEGQSTGGEAPKEPKKRGRKPKVKVAEEVVAGAGGSIVREAVEPVVGQPKPSLEPVTGEPKPWDTSSPTVPSTTKVEGEDITNREQLKFNIKQILANNANILYADIALQLGIDEDLVSTLCDEIDKEGNQ